MAFSEAGLRRRRLLSAAPHVVGYFQSLFPGEKVLHLLERWPFGSLEVLQNQTRNVKKSIRSYFLRVVNFVEQTAHGLKPLQRASTKSRAILPSKSSLGLNMVMSIPIKRMLAIVLRNTSESSSHDSPPGIR